MRGERPSAIGAVTEKSIPLGRSGLRYIPGYLASDKQRRLLAAVQAVLQEAPLFSPTMPRSGNPLSVRMSNCGPLGWVTDSAGYRYQPNHPETGRPWPGM